MTNSIKDYQEKFVEISKARFGEDYNNHRNLIKHLAGEVVELQEAITDTLGLTMAKRTRIIGGEIADCIACCMVAADILGVDLDKALEEKIKEKSIKVNSDYLQGARFICMNDKELSVFHDVEELYVNVLAPFVGRLKNENFRTVKRMIEDVEEVAPMFIYELVLFLNSVGFPEFKTEDFSRWAKTLKEFKAKEKELGLICGGKE